MPAPYVLATYLEEGFRVDTRLECAMCATLLGQIQDAVTLLRDDAVPSSAADTADAMARRGRAARLRREAWRFVDETSPDELGEGFTPGMLACTSRWLSSACLPFFADTKVLDSNVNAYFDAPAVVRYATALSAGRENDDAGRSPGVIGRVTSAMRGALCSLGDAVAGMRSPDDRGLAAAGQALAPEQQGPAAQPSSAAGNATAPSTNNAVAFAAEAAANEPLPSPAAPRIVLRDPLTWPLLARQSLFAAAVGATAAGVGATVAALQSSAGPNRDAPRQQWTPAPATVMPWGGDADAPSSSMSRADVEAAVRRWQFAKADAMGPSRRVQGLDNAATAAVRNEWRNRSAAAKNAHVYWKFQLKDISVVSINALPPPAASSGPYICHAKVMIRESATLVDDTTNRPVPGGTGSYDGAYSVEYEFERARSPRAPWKVSKATVLH